MQKPENQFLLEAYRLALRGEGKTRPNPPVGAVIVRKGKIIGRGWHHHAGGDHAEVAAIKNAGAKCCGAELYVTLEPCSRVGRVGACTDAIIAAGIAKVCYACKDPNPTNRGRAARVLKKADIECVQTKLKLCDDLIKPFAKHVNTGLPFVTVKLAMSLDGKICDDWHDAKWISSESMRKLTGSLRERVDAIMVGAETIRRDNPSLLSHSKPNPDLIRVVISRSGRLPPKSQVFTDGKNDTLVFPDAELAIRELGKMGIMHVLCEGGMQLAVSLAEAGLVDDWLTVLSPKVIGARHLKECTIIKDFRVLEDK